MTELRKGLDRSVPAAEKLPLGVALHYLIEFTDRLSENPEQLRQLLEFGRAVRSSGVPGRHHAERELLGTLSWITGLCKAHDDETETDEKDETEPPGFETERRTKPLSAAQMEVFLELRDYALDCLVFKRSRDSFSGQRRALAYEILGEVGRRDDLPDVVLRARKQLQEPDAVETRAAADFLLEYYSARDLPIDDEIVAELLAMSERTSSRTNIFGALNALVETGVIGEMEALGRMDDWKDRHDG